MNLQKKLQQLEQIYEKWQKNPQDGDLYRQNLALLAYLLRAGIGEDPLKQIRSIEVKLKRSLEALMEGWAKAVQNLPFQTPFQTPLQALQVLRSSQNQYELLKKFFQWRDEAELSWAKAKEYAEEEQSSQGKWISEVRHFLNKIDDFLFFDKELFFAFKEIAAQELAKYFDRDFFWWFSPVSERCFLPSHRRDEYLTQHLNNTLSHDLHTGFTTHLQKCNDCRQDIQTLSDTLTSEEAPVKELQEEIPQEIGNWIKVLLAPSSLAFAHAKSTKMPKMQKFCWQDERNQWQLQLYLSDPCTEENLCFMLQTTPEGAWKGKEIVLDETVFQITPEAYIFCPPQKLVEAWQKRIFNITVRNSWNKEPFKILYYQRKAQDDS
jgi:hypothetical protein